MEKYELGLLKLECSELKSVDFTGNDPFVLLTMSWNNVSIRTPTRNKARSSAKWDDIDLRIVIDSFSTGKVIQIEVFDWNRTSKNVLIGSAILDLSSIAPPVHPKNCEFHVDLSLRSHSDGKASGKLRMQLKWISTQLELIDNAPLISGSSLPPQDPTVKPSSANGEIVDLSLREGNNACADCDTDNPTWASVNNGVFICTGKHDMMYCPFIAISP